MNTRHAALSAATLTTTFSSARGLREGNRATRWLRAVVLQRVAFAVFVCACLAGGAGRAATRPLWHDELLTVHISKLPDVGAMWDALAAGVDLNPPLVHLATRAALNVGDSPLAARLPSLLGFGLALVGVFVIAVRYQSMRVGWLAAALFAWTQAATYSYEARPYALVLACSAWAFACWQRAPGRPAWAVGLALALAGNVSSHYYSVLLFLPLAVGELIRTWERRRVEVGVWLALLVAVTPLLAWLPLMRAAQEFSTHYWGQPSIEAMVNTFVWLLSGATIPVLVLVGTSAMCFALHVATADDRSSAAPEHASIPLSDWTVALLIAALPVLVFLLGLITGAFTERYALAAAIGWCVLFARVTHQLASTPSARFALLAGTAAVITVTVAKHLPDARGIAVAPSRVPALSVFDHVPPAPHRIVITEGVLYLQLAEYAPPKLRERMMFAGMPDRALAIARSNTTTEGLRRLRRFVPIQTEPFDTVIAGREPLLVYGRTGWVTTLLRQSGASLRLLAEDDERVLLHASWEEVHMPGPGRASSRGEQMGVSSTVNPAP